jgi:AraC family transcriptional regulator, regulatory protein of adaptative response / methylated-DNA-[protein]-cysteine methyltransferase
LDHELGPIVTLGNPDARRARETDRQAPCGRELTVSRLRRIPWIVMRMDDPTIAAPAMAPVDRPQACDYALVRRAIEYLTAHTYEPPDHDHFAGRLGVSVERVQRMLRRWCGLSLTEFAHALTRSYIQSQLAAAGTVFDGDEPGASRTHAFEIRIAATICDDARRRGAGLGVVYGFHACPFGEALVMMAEGGLCGLAFIDDDAAESRRVALEDMTGRWPQASFSEAPTETGAMAAHVFSASGADAGDTLPVVLIGTPFDVRVWEALLAIPMGRLVSYADIARHLGRPSASRAIGTANGRNPISFVVPCHRALRGDGNLGGYYWGLARKRALIAWEAGRRNPPRCG